MNICEYLEYATGIIGWIDADTPKTRLVEQCFAQKGAPEVSCHGEESKCSCKRYKKSEEN